MTLKRKDGKLDFFLIFGICSIEAEMLTLGKLTDFQILFLIIQTKKGKSGTVEVASLIVAS